MRLRHIEVFHAIRAHGSISRASEVLAISQPAVSKVLKHAEISLGFPLFRRAHGRLEPTEEAEILFAQTERLMVELDGVRRVGRNLRQHLGAPLRIGCLPGLGLRVVPLAATLYRRARPQAALDIGIRRSADLAHALLTHELDLGIDVGPVQGFSAAAGLEATPLFEGEMVYIDGAGKAPASERAGRIRIADINQERLIGLNPDDPMGGMVRQALEQQGVDDVAAVRVHTNFIAKAIVDMGGGCAFVDEFTAMSGNTEGVRVKRLEPQIRFAVYVLVPGFRPRPRGADEFIRALHEASEQLEEARDALRA